MALNMAFRLVNHQEAAEELVQDAFLHAFTQLDQLQDPSAYGAWLYRILYRRCLAYLRKHKQRPMQTRLSPTLQDTENEGANQLEQDDRKEAISLVMRQLKPKEQLVLDLYYLQGWSLKEIHHNTGLTSSHIKVLLFRARKRFKALSATLISQDLLLSI